MVRPVKRTHYTYHKGVSIPLNGAWRKTDLVTVQVPHSEASGDTEYGECDRLRLREVGRVDQRPVRDGLAAHALLVMRVSYHDLVTSTNEYR